VPFSRTALIKAGAELEQRFGPTWLVHSVSKRTSTTRHTMVIVDAVRTSAQARALKAAFPSATLIHLSADHPVRQARFEGRTADGFTEATTFEMAADETEAEVTGEVEGLADCVIDTSNISANETVAAALRCLNAR
jgi:RNase adaptor protein for sRNA GlmZ degradation